MATISTENSVRIRLAAFSSLVASWLMVPAFAQVDVTRVAEQLAQVNAEVAKRNEAFMREMNRRKATLSLDALVGPESLSSPEGRSRIRAGFHAYSSMLDEIDAFGREQRTTVARAIDQVAKGLAPFESQALREGYAKGYNRTSARYEDLYRLQREEIQTTMDLLDLLDRAPGEVKLAGGELLFGDPKTRDSFRDLIGRLERLAHAQIGATREILEARRRSARAVQELPDSDDTRR